MKKSIKIFAIAMTFGFCGILTSSATSTNSPVVSIENEKCNDDDDDLRCVLRDDDGHVLAACWFCDCAAVAAAIN